MSQRKKTKMPLGKLYLYTILATIVIVGAAAYVILKVTVFKNHTAAEKNFIAPFTVQFEGTQTDSQNILFIGEADGKLSALSLVRIDAVEKEILCVPIPAESVVQVNTKIKTLKEFYQQDDLKTMMTGIEVLLNTPVQRYCVLNREKFNSIINIVGGVQFPVPDDLYYENPETGEITSFSSKNTDAVLSGDDIRKIMTYPLYRNGKEYNTSVSGTLTALIINTLSEKSAIDDNVISDVFAVIISSEKTNITAEDYAISKNAFHYILSDVYHPATYLISRGDWESAERFNYAADFSACLLEYFNNT